MAEESGSFHDGEAHGGGGRVSIHTRKGHRKSMVHANIAESLKIRQVCSSAYLHIHVGLLMCK